MSFSTKRNPHLPKRSQLLDALSKKNGPHSTIYMINGDKYIGSFSQNKKSGHGTYHYSRLSAIYQGEFLNDRREGYGTYSITANKAIRKVYAGGGRGINDMDKGFIFTRMEMFMMANGTRVLNRVGGK